MAGLALAYLVTAFVDKPAPVHFQPGNPYAAQQSAIVEPETALVAEKNIMKLGSPLSVLPEKGVPDANPLAVLEEVVPPAKVNATAAEPAPTAQGEGVAQAAPEAAPQAAPEAAPEATPAAPAVPAQTAAPRRRGPGGARRGGHDPDSRARSTLGGRDLRPGPGSATPGNPNDIKAGTSGAKEHSYDQNGNQHGRHRH